MNDHHQDHRHSLAEDLQIMNAMVARRRMDGRWPHIHFEVFSSLANALGGRYAVLTSRFCMPAAFCSTIYADTITYLSSASIFKGVSLSTDNVFGDNTAAPIAQQTPTFASDGSGSYTATALIGIAR